MKSLRDQITDAFLFLGLMSAWIWGPILIVVAIHFIAPGFEQRTEQRQAFAAQVQHSRTKKCKAALDITTSGEALDYRAKSIIRVMECAANGGDLDACREAIDDEPMARQIEKASKRADIYCDTDA